MSRSKSKIEFYEGVPISTDFKHEPLFDSKSDQEKFFNKYKKGSLTFEGSYQRVEEQIKTAFKYEQLVNINYVHVINPSFEGAPEEESEWWGFVIDIHYINDGLVTVDWVVDPVQTFMFRWDLNKAFIERGMLDIVKQDENKYRYLDKQNAAILSNDEAIGVDGLAHYLFHDNVMKAHSNYESDIVFLILLIGDSENKSFVGIPSQIEYYVLPYDRKRGRLINFEISDVRGGQGYTTIKSESNGDWSILYALDQISKDMDLTKGGKAILGGYIQNHIGLDFEVDATEGTTDVKITAAMARSEWEPPLGSRSNLEIYKAGESGGEDSGGGGDNGGGDGGNGGGEDNGSSFTNGDIVNVGFTISNANINLLLKYARRRNMMPSFLITQLFIESRWGDPNTSLTGVQDNNWAGISMPFRPPAGVTVTQGTPRPSNEGGYYVRFASMDDFFNSYCFVLSKENGLYNVEGKTTLEDYVRGLFRVGGANADYAASGFDHYLGLMAPTYTAIKNQNSGKLEELDRLASSN